MRGAEFTQEGLFTVAKPDYFVPIQHPPRKVPTLVDATKPWMSGRFNLMQADRDRALVPPEWLLRVKLLELPCPVRSVQLLMESLHDNLL
jgi:hypothetical protein